MPGLGGILRKSKKAEVKETVKIEPKGISRETYLKAMPLRDLSELEIVKSEVNSGNILILKITPLANKSLEDVKRAVDDLRKFVKLVGGDLARLGEERVVVCPSNVKIWREKISNRLE